MAYVPGKPHDLFLSYAHAESEWVEAFRSKLEKALWERLGRPVEFWKDTHELRIGQIWKDEIAGALQETVAFLAVSSSIYHQQEFCRREYRWYLNHHQALDDYSRVRDRFIPIIKTRGLDERARKFAEAVQHVAFHGADGVAFATHSPDFDKKLNEAASGIAEILFRQRAARTRVDIADAAMDIAGDRGKLVAQLEARGYDAQPFDEQRGEQLTVFLLGAEYDGVVEHLWKCAIDCGRRIICWIDPIRLKKANQAQRKFVEAVQSSGAELLGSSNVGAAATEIEQLLKGSREEPAAGGPKPSVVLLEDPSDAREAPQPVRALLDDRFTVLPPPDARLEDVLHRLPEYLASADGALVHRPARPLPDPWLAQTFYPVQFADRIYRADRPPLLARTFVLGDPNALAAIAPPGDAHVIACPGPVTAETLAPFFARMGKARPAHGGR